MKQLKLGFFKDYTKEFGGELLVGRRKSQRPLSVKKPLHLVIRSSHHKAFTPHNLSLRKLISKTAEKFGVKIFNVSLNWSHIHAVIKIRNRSDYVGFIRVLNSVIAQKIQMKFVTDKSVFTLRPFTRILEWGRDLRRTLDYVILNEFESVGMLKRKKELPGKSRSD